MKPEKVEGQCEHCGTDYKLEAVVDGNQVITCPTCGKETDNWDTPESPQMAPTMITLKKGNDQATGIHNSRLILD